MQEEIKYYTAKESDFQEGLEFEYNEYDEEKDEFTGNWIKSYFDLRCGLGHDMTHFLHDGQIRIKCLDKKDIEDLGWVNTSSTMFSPLSKVLVFVLNDPDHYLDFWYENQEVVINNGKSWEEYECYFKGTIKNKSELKKLMSQLGIK
jgi:hypothetical protein